ncbi:MAG: sigma-70 family RNA polymerase sigma factor [Clostridiales bacterium]|nr:sigma-70 family RNA polymerase sigma factor [Clostridiales bacterium]
MHGKGMQQKVEDAVLDSYETMYRIAYTYVKNEEDALDIVQESAYKAIRNCGQVKKERYIQTWLCRIVINTSMDFLRKTQREFPIEELYEVNEPEITDQYEDFDMTKAMNTLTERERAVVILRYFEDKKLEDIAYILNANLSTVKSLLYRSLKKLKLEMVEGELQYEG